MIYFVLKIFLAFNVIISSGFVANAKDISFDLYFAGHRLKVIIKDNFCKKDQAQKLLKYALLRMPTSWIKKVKRFIFFPKNRRIFKILKVKKPVVAQYIPVLDWVYYHNKLDEDTLEFFYKTILHEYAHANGYIRRLYNWKLIPELYKRLKDPNRYYSSYAESLWGIKRMEEFWAEIAAATLYNPIYMRDHYYEDYALVKRVIQITDPHFDLIKHYKLIKRYILKETKEIINKLPTGVIIKVGNTVNIRLYTGKIINVNIKYISRPVLYASAALPMDIFTLPIFINEMDWYRISKKVHINDRIFLYKKKLFLMKPLSSFRKKEMQKKKFI